VTRWPDMLELPEQITGDALAKGDNWNRQVLTERDLSRKPHR